MAKILADEHFPVRIQDRLRRLGHDVTAVRQYHLNKSGDGNRMKRYCGLRRSKVSPR